MCYLLVKYEFIKLVQIICKITLNLSKALDILICNFTLEEN